jgi:acyl carrier protein
MQVSNTVHSKFFRPMNISDDDPIDLMVRDLLSEKLGIDFHLIHPDTSLSDDLDIDSLDLIETVSELEKRFKIKINDEEVEKLRNVGDVTKLVQLKMK